MFGNLGLMELLVIFAIIMVIFGAGKLPQLGKGLGEGNLELPRRSQGQGREETRGGRRKEERVESPVRGLSCGH